MRVVAIIESWHEIPFADLDVTFRVETPLFLPTFSGNTLRTALELSVRKMVCVTPRKTDCEDCPIWQLCAYRRLFVAPKDGKTRHIPYRPCINWIEGPAPHEFSPGETVTLRMRLFGIGVEYYPYFHMSMERMGAEGIGLRNSQGQRGRLALTAVHQRLPQQQPVPIHTEDQKSAVFPLSPTPLGTNLDVPQTSRLRLKMLAPLRVEKDGHFNDRLEFPALFQSILRRLRALTLHTFDQEPAIDQNDLRNRTSRVVRSEVHLHWKDYERYSSRQHSTMRLGGVVGEITYDNIDPQLLPFLKFGELAGVGKGLAFGFGRYVILE